MTGGTGPAIITRPALVDRLRPPEDARPTRALLFDFDGVIADTENVHVAAWQRTLGVMGWIESDESCARAAEVDDRDFVAEVFARRKIVGGDVDGWARRKQGLTHRLLADAPMIYPGVAGLLERLNGRVRLGIVTTTWRENVVAVLEAAGLAKAFEFIVAKEDVPAPKPDPGGYRLALTKLGLAAAGVAALEDSPAGLKAARAAGLRVVAVGHRRPRGDWSGDAPFLNHLTDLDQAIRLLGVMA